MSQDYCVLWLADYNIYARILANRLKMTINDVLYDTQYSAVTGRNILDATAALLFIITAGTRTNRGICLMALDFSRAYDNISHTYLQGLLTKYNYGDGIKRAVLSIYANAQSRIAINGHFTSGEGYDSVHVR